MSLQALRSELTQHFDLDQPADTLDISDLTTQYELLFAENDYEHGAARSLIHA